MSIILLIYYLVYSWYCIWMHEKMNYGQKNFSLLHVLVFFLNLSEEIIFQDQFKKSHCIDHTHKTKTVKTAVKGDKDCVNKFPLHITLFHTPKLKVFHIFKSTQDLPEFLCKHRNTVIATLTPPKIFNVKGREAKERVGCLHLKWCNNSLFGILDHFVGQ